MNTKAIKFNNDGLGMIFMLFVLALSILMYSSYIPFWCIAVSILILIWRGWISVNEDNLPSKWTLISISFFVLILILLNFGFSVSKLSGLSVVITFLSLKTLEMKSSKDSISVFIFGGFLVLLSFTFSQSIFVAVSTFILSFGLLASLINSHIPDTPKRKDVPWLSIKYSLSTSAKMMLFGAPFAIFLFFVFPRVGPIWGMNQEDPSGKTGLSDRMTVGSVARLALDDSVAMRIKFMGENPPRNSMYFRGPVLSSFDGSVWTSLPKSEISKSSFDGFNVSGQIYKYEVTLEPTNQSWIMAMDATREKPKLSIYSKINEEKDLDLLMTSGAQWISNSNINDRFSYIAQSSSIYSIRDDLSKQDLLIYKELPQGYNPRTINLAKEIKADPRNFNADSKTLANFALNKLATGRYTYTLNPGIYGENSADEFWFDRKAGFCEHIASSFVILMRAMGVPARIVTGYQGAEIDGDMGKWVVRQNSAHAWAEVWVNNKEWVRYDPTQFVDPGRINFDSSRSSLSITESLFNGIDGDFISAAKSMMSAINSSWNSNVLGFERYKQDEFLGGFGFVSFFKWVFYISIASFLSFVLWMNFKKYNSDPWINLLEKAKYHLERNSIEIPKNASIGSILRCVESNSFASGSNKFSKSYFRNWILGMESYKYAPIESDRPKISSLRKDLDRLFRR